MKTNNYKSLTINSEKGVALIIALGILAILSILGTSFAINMRLEQKASANYRDMVKAAYIAEAGIEKGIAELLSTSDIYIKNNFDTLTHTWASTIQSDPSEFDKTILGEGWTGNYKVEIRDASAMICVNDRNPNLADMLTNLGIAINACDTNTVNDTEDICLPSGFASDIVDYWSTINRDYRTKGEVNIVPGNTNEAYNADIDYKKFKDFITTRAEVNPDVNRAPINVNTASPEVLMAIIGGVTGLPTDLECIAVVEAILSYRSGKDYDYVDGEKDDDSTADHWEIGDGIIGDEEPNPFDGFDSNRGDALDPDVSGFDSDGLDNDGDGSVGDNLEDCYLFAGGARGEFEALINLLTTVSYCDEGTINLTTAENIIQNTDPYPDPNPSFPTDPWSTEFGFRTRNFEITSTGKLFRNDKKVAEKKMIKIIQR